LLKNPKNPSSPELFSELEAFFHGRSTCSWLYFGAHPAQDAAGTEGYRFRVWAPGASRVSVVGPFNNWDPLASPLKKDDSGVWAGFLPGLSPHTPYQYAVKQPDGSFVNKADPFAFYTSVFPHTSSRLWDPLSGSYVWSDQDWMAYRSHTPLRHRPMNLYECHLGSWRRTGDGHFLSYREVALYLVPYLKEMGFTHVEFLPIMEHPLEASWGYQSTGYFAPTSRFGSPDDFKYLIDQLHQAGIGVLLDWVPGHFPRDSFGLHRFDGSALYERPDEATLWGTSPFDLSRGPVRSFLLSSALYWIEQFHADGLRIGSLSVLQDREDGRSLLRDLSVALSAAHPDVLLTGEDGPEDLTRPLAEGGLGFHFRWDAHSPAALWAGTPQPPAPSGHIAALSHDQTAHHGASLLRQLPVAESQRFPALRAYYTRFLASPGKKLLFMGAEYAQEGPWQFQHSLDWHLLRRRPHLEALTFFRTIHALYLEQPALWQRDDDPSALQVLESGPVTAFLRLDDEGSPLLAVCNLTDKPLTGLRLGVPKGGSWAVLLHTEDSAFGGCGADLSPIHADKVPGHGQPRSLTLDLPPLSAVLLAPVSHPAV